MTKQKIIIYLFVITFIAGFLRFYNNWKNPVSLTVDEVSFGYNAYSILKTGRDEYGKFLPLTFKSVGDYKNPVPLYTMVPSIAFFGLNEFAVRFPTALISTLSIPLFFLLFRKITKKNNYALIGSFLIAISPWHIYFSRYLNELTMAGVFISAGIYFYIKALEDDWRWIFLSSFFFVLSTYTYYAERLFVPLFLTALVFINYKKFLKNRNLLFYFTITSFILEIPLLYNTFFGPDIARANMVFISKDIDFTRPVLLYGVNFAYTNIFYYPLLFFYWVRKYLAYFSPSFLFYSGLPMTAPGSYGLGVLYLFEAITLPLGIYRFIKDNILYKNHILTWLFIGLIPASLTNNEQHAGRAIIILPVFVLLSTFGVYQIYKLLKKTSKVYIKYTFTIAILALITWDLIHAFMVFSVYFPIERDEDFMNGTKEAVNFVLQNGNNYKEIVFDPYRGIVAPFIVSIPHMYILFYSKYDPRTYQTEVKRMGNEEYGFGNYTIRKINWPVDRQRPNTLFVGSPWVIDEKNIPSQNILKKIYLENGSLAFVVAKSDK